MNILDFVQMNLGNDETIFSVEIPIEPNIPNKILFRGTAFELYNHEEVCKMTFDVYTIYPNPEKKEDFIVKLYITQ